MLTEQHRRDLEKTIKQQRKELRRLQAVEQAHWSMLWRFKDERDAYTAEITQLRAELAAKEEAHQSAFDVCARRSFELVAELEQERQLADRLALAGRKVEFGASPFELDDMLREHATRRNK